MRYVEKYLRPGMKSLKIGAVTDRYSHAPARMGYAMDAELFDMYLRCHFPICDRGDFVGASHHILDIHRKNG